MQVKTRRLLLAGIASHPARPCFKITSCAALLQDQLLLLTRCVGRVHAGYHVDDSVLPTCCMHKLGLVLLPARTLGLGIARHLELLSLHPDPVSGSFVPSIDSMQQLHHWQV
eukprot:COSAG02_NODE_8344_length_2604_cov_25.631521_3_plen_112_part_00